MTLFVNAAFFVINGKVRGIEDVVHKFLIARIGDEFMLLVVEVREVCKHLEFIKGGYVEIAREYRDLLVLYLLVDLIEFGASHIDVKRSKVSVEEMHRRALDVDLKTAELSDLIPAVTA